MAGDWIKIEHGILGKPEVMRLCDLLDCGPHQVVGHLTAFWLWCDTNMSSICPRVMGTKRGLDGVAGRDGFCDAMIEVGWLYVEDGQVWVPNYETHLSKSAKQRAGEQRKKALQRSGMSPHKRDKTGTGQGTDTGTELGTVAGTKPGLEKRREEKSLNTPLIPQGGEVVAEVDPPQKPKRKPKAATVGEWSIPHGWDSEKLRNALGAFERMRESIGKRIKDRANASMHFKSFDNADHLIYALEFAVANEYQGIKPDYRPQQQSKPEPKQEKELPMITELPPYIVEIYKRKAEERRKRDEEFERTGHYRTV